MFWCSPDPHADLAEDTLLLAFTIRVELAEFEVDYAVWLRSPHGRFEQYYAERQRGPCSQDANPLARIRVRGNP